MSHYASTAKNSGSGKPGEPLTASQTTATRLAQFFPAASPLRLPVSVRDEAGTCEETVIEFGTRREVLFACTLPLEFGEHVSLRNADGSLDAEADIVALQLQDGQTAVAARFAHDVANWIVQ